MSTTTVLAPAPTRLVSLDALRGFDMFWILGADAVVVGLGALTQFAPMRALAEQLEHKGVGRLRFTTAITIPKGC